METEDKAKRYDEALERARKVHNETEFDYEKGMIEEIFPELKENEDKKMKKAIIATIHLYYGEPLEDEAKEMISWLKKQGETNKTPKFKVGD